MFTIGEELRGALAEMKQSGVYMSERLMESPQAVHVTSAGKELLNFCANNYLGLATHPAVVAAAKSALDEHGFGMASVRLICGTQTQHVNLERSISNLLHTESTILYSSCFDANTGIFEVLLDERDTVISDELNHASIIDGIRLSKAARYRYRNRDLRDLEEQLRLAASARRRIIVTDGVFSMDGYLAPLAGICDLADRYGALVMVDDSHAVGLLGPTGAGTPEFAGVQDRVDLLSGTLGKALGGASGGYISGRAEIVDLLRQRSRPYLFSNALPPAVVAGSLAALELVRSSSAARDALRENAALFRRRMTEEGFNLLPGEHPIIPVMFPEGSATARQMADTMLDHGVYVTAFGHPIVPRHRERIRVQLSAMHTPADIQTCVRAFTKARAALAVTGRA